MSQAEAFDLGRARAAMEKALERAGFDLVPDEPNLLQATRDRGGASSVVVVDSGGQMRYTCTRQAGPERGQTHKSGRWTLQVTRQASEMATVSYQLSAQDASDFGALLAALATLDQK